MPIFIKGALTVEFFFAPLSAGDSSPILALDIKGTQNETDFPEDAARPVNRPDAPDRPRIDSG
jgi:hypothetical protein